MSSTGGQHLIFRTLRHDESASKINLKCLHTDKEWQQLVEEHLKHGSVNGRDKVLVSFTAELYVALAFAGMISDIAVVDISKLNPDEIKLQRLDKEYLRAQLKSEIEKMHSKRADEVLLGSNPRSMKATVIEATKLPTTIKAVKRTLHPIFWEKDKDNFPSEEDFKTQNIQYIGCVGGPSKRFYKILIGDKRYIAHSSRPNVDKESLLFGNRKDEEMGSLRLGDELLQLGKHEFMCFCCYRLLVDGSVPNCAHYEFDLEYEIESTKTMFKWGLILMEPFSEVKTDEMATHKEKLLQLSDKLYPADVLLGNWNCGGKCKTIEQLFQQHVYVKLDTEEDQLVRVLVDRSLGCCYPEDRVKRPYDIVIFQNLNSAQNLMLKLPQTYPFLYLKFFRENEKATTESTLMHFHLDSLLDASNLKNLERCIQMCGINLADYREYKLLSNCFPEMIFDNTNMFEFLRKRIEILHLLSPCCKVFPTVLKRNKTKVGSVNRRYTLGQNRVKPIAKYHKGKLRETKESLISADKLSNSQINFPQLLSMEFRLMSINVHGFSNPERTKLIDKDIYALVRDFKPDVCCLQEVKHPFPAYPEGDYIVRLSKDKSQLLRYTGYESNEEIRRRLNMTAERNMSDLSSTLQAFISNNEIRRSKKYLEKIFEEEDNVSIEDSKENHETILDIILKQYGSDNMKAVFHPDFDETFGTAMIAEQKHFERCSQHKLKKYEDDEQERVASKIIWKSSDDSLEICVVNLHLDPKKEETRLMQMQDIFEWLDKDHTPSDHLLCGDFNALDTYYSNQEHVQMDRRWNNLEKPKSKLYDMIIERGYQDLENVKPARATCQYKTRVDYIFCSKALFDRSPQIQLEVVPSGSDHKCMKIVLKFCVNVETMAKII